MDDVAGHGRGIGACLSERVIEQNGTRILELRTMDGAGAPVRLDGDVNEGRTDAAAVSVTGHPDWRESIARGRRDHGGVLLRGLQGLDAGVFHQVVAGFGARLLQYEFGSTPRSKVANDVYSSTEYPAGQWIDQHNEQSYSRQWPGTIWFYCDIPARERGATPVADSREVYRRIDPALRRHFARHGVMYVRNYGNGLDVPWEQVFGTEDRQVAERYCSAHGIEFEWLDNGDALRTRQVCQSEWVHPVSGETVWFNQAHLFHLSNLAETVQEALCEIVDEDRLPRHTYFGDGSPIDVAMLDEIRAVYRDTMLTFAWEAGDVLLLDNVLMSHGREPFVGPRRVLVAMTE